MIQEEIVKTKDKIFIMVVEDNEDNMNLIFQILSEECYGNIMRVMSGSEALILIRERVPDLVLLDIMMPDIDGYEICRSLQRDKETSDIPIIMVTAKTEAEDLRRGFEVGAFDYIKKPFDEIELIARVQSALKLKQSKDELKTKNIELLSLAQQNQATIDMLGNKIGEVKRADEELQESKFKSEAILDAIPGLMFCFTREGEFLDFKADDIKELYVSPDRIIGKKFCDILPPELTEKFLNYTEKALDSGIMQVFEYDFKLPEGHKHFEGRIVASGTNEAIAIVRNITKGKHSENTLEEEKAKKQKYLDIAEVMFVSINAKKEVTMINKKGCEILGLSQEEIIGKNWFDNFLPIELRDNLKSDFEKLMKKETELAEFSENPVLTKNGEERTISWHNTLLEDEQGNIVGALISGEDITDFKRQEKELKPDFIKSQPNRYPPTLFM